MRSRRHSLQRSKADGYVGFCRKAGKLTCGFNAVEVQRGDVYLLLLCHTASDNAKKSAKKLSERFGCGLMLLEGKTLEEVTGRPNCKLAAVRDENLAKAILSSADENYRLYSGGNV